MEKREQADLLQAVTKSCQRHALNDDLGNAVSPRVYDYNGYERNAISFLIYASGTYSLMPEEAQKDQEAADQHELAKVELDVEQKFPNTYTFKAYYVEC